jgi:hypothetical protein
MKMAIVDVVSADDVKALSRVNHNTYSASLHALYKVCYRPYSNSIDT